MMIKGKLVARIWTFESSSGNGTYETVLYTTGETSCGCRGWCNRVAKDGSRTCKHTRLVEQGIDVADLAAVGHKVYSTVAVSGTKSKASQARVPPSTPREPPPKTGGKSRFVQPDVPVVTDELDVERFRRMGRD